MFVAPGTLPILGYKLTREAAQQIARNWWLLLLNGALLVVAGVLIFSIEWTTRSLATFIGALFIFHGVGEALTTGIGSRVRQVNVIAGQLSIAAGILIIVWPDPGVVVVAIVLGAWLIVVGTISISGAFAARRLLPNWWLLLVLGLVELPLGVLALANPGATLAALITVAGIWAVATGVLRIVLAFDIKDLPDDVDEALAAPSADGAPQAASAKRPPLAATGS
jgi:uncharacterized membrane protein HdeD (DUF308 family)